jgi:hypothetical protein
MRFGRYYKGLRSKLKDRCESTGVQDDGVGEKVLNQYLLTVADKGHGEDTSIGSRPAPQARQKRRLQRHWRKKWIAHIC